jgi:hypothetical protein
MKTESNLPVDQPASKETERGRILHFLRLPLRSQSAVRLKPSTIKSGGLPWGQNRTFAGINCPKAMAGLIVLLLAGAAAWWLLDAVTKGAESGPPLRVVGTLPPRDLTEIRCLVRREIWRGVLPKFDWWSIRNLPAAVRSRASQRIRGITAQPNGTVEVITYGKDIFKGDIEYPYGLMLKLRKGQNGWQITEGGWWES